jgi:hypothetical protein
MSHWIGCIRLLDFDVKHCSGRLDGGSHVLSWQPEGEGVPEPEERNDIEESIEAKLVGEPEMK